MEILGICLVISVVAICLYKLIKRCNCKNKINIDTKKYK